MIRLFSFVPLVLLLLSFGCSKGSTFGCAKGSTNNVKPGGTAITATPSSVCVAAGETQQFEASASGVTWSVVSTSPGAALGTISSDGLFTAGSGPTSGLVVTTKGEDRGAADITVVSGPTGCKTMDDTIDKYYIVGPKKVEKKDEEEEGEDAKEPFGSTAESKWSAQFDFELIYEVKGSEDGFAGYVTCTVIGGFWFTIDYANEILKIAKPMGMVNVFVSDDIPMCDAAALADTFIWVVGIDGRLDDKNFIFNKDFVSLDHKEGHGLTCMGYGTADANASMVDLIGKYAFPVTIPATDGASIPIQTSFTFVGRVAKISGTMSVHEL